METEKNKIALITGGSRGLGKSMALQLGQSGTDIILTYQSQKEAAYAVVKELELMGNKAVALHYDSSLIPSLPAFVKSIKEVLHDQWQTEHFDFLINNAGIGASIAFENVQEDDFDKFLNIHFKSVYFLSQQLLPLINANGRIINISSTSTQFCVNGYSVYASMKGAVEVFTKYLATLAASKNITVNIIAPGPVETDFNGAAIRNNPDRKKIMATQTTLGRVGAADDIGSIIALLCNERSGWITGQRIDASGGICLSLQSSYSK
jgi:NAD(P)-dependent dehydrogenase (short-subunit alcohol dehydrogenase family)